MVSCLLCSQQAGALRLDCSGLAVMEIAFVHKRAGTVIAASLLHCFGSVISVVWLKLIVSSAGIQLVVVPFVARFTQAPWNIGLIAFIAILVYTSVCCEICSRVWQAQFKRVALGHPPRQSMGGHPDGLQEHVTSEQDSGSTSNGCRRPRQSIGGRHIGVCSRRQVHTWVQSGHATVCQSRAGAERTAKFHVKEYTGELSKVTARAQSLCSLVFAVRGVLRDPLAQTQRG